MPKRTSIARLQAEYGRYCRRINASWKRCAFVTVDKDFAEPYVEVRADGYHYIASERGQECFHRITTKNDTLLYWLLSDLTFELATKYELNHRVLGQDSRRIWIAKQIELMAKASVKWADTLRQEREVLLAMCPFDDGHKGAEVVALCGLAKSR